MATDVFYVAAATMNGDGSIISLNQTVNSGPSGAGPKIMFRIGNNDDVAGTLDIAAILVWSEHLTAAQLKTLHNDLKAVYASLLS